MRKVQFVTLRAAPKQGSVAEWLGAKQLTRSIGGVYREEAARLYDVPVVPGRSYDVLFFVENTTFVREPRTGHRGN